MQNIRANFEKELLTRLAQRATTGKTEESILLRSFKYFDLDNDGNYINFRIIHITF